MAIREDSGSNTHDVVIDNISEVSCGHGTHDFKSKSLKWEANLPVQVRFRNTRNVLKP